MPELLDLRLSRTVHRVERRLSMESPYHHLHLRRNPFGELTQDERASLAVVDVAQWVEALKDRKTALQFIGAKGHGKTTHLLAIKQSLSAGEYVYLPEDGPQPAIPRTRPLFIDEAQRLSRFARWRVFKRGGPLVLGTHEDLTDELRQSRLNVIVVSVEANQSPERLANILNQRIKASCLPNTNVPLITLDQAKELQQQFGGDIREVENHLYDLIQAAAQKESTWPLVI
jgi:hypothetical protein